MRRIERDALKPPKTPEDAASRSIAAAASAATGGWGALAGIAEMADAREVAKRRAYEKLAALTGDDAAAATTAADRVGGDPDDDRYFRGRLQGAVDFATMTWRLGTDKKSGAVEMELLEAARGPGKYDPDDGVTTAATRVKSVPDIARAPPRFPKPPKTTTTTTTAAAAAAAAADNDDDIPEDIRVVSEDVDVAAAFEYTRPRTDLGGIITPVPADRPPREPDLADDALYDVQKGLEYLRTGANARGPDLSRGGERGAGGGGGPRPSAAGPDAPDFYDVDESATARRAPGAPEFSKVTGRGGIAGVGDAASSASAPRREREMEFADGDVLYLEPAAADATVYPRRDKSVPDISATGARPETLRPSLTADVDYLYDDVLAARYPRLDGGTGAVRFDAGAGREGGRSTDPTDRTTTGDLDAGAYHDESAAADAGAKTTARTRAPVADFASASRKEIADFDAATGVADRGGDALVLDPRDPSAPGVADAAAQMAALRVADPETAARRESMRASRPRWDGAGDGAGGFDPGGDVLALEPSPPPRTRATDFASAPGRGDGDVKEVFGARGAFYTLVPIRQRRRGERRSLRTFAGDSLRPPLPVNPRPRRLSTPSDAFELHPRVDGGSRGARLARGAQAVGDDDARSRARAGSVFGRAARRGGRRRRGRGEARGARREGGGEGAAAGGRRVEAGRRRPGQGGHRVMHDLE